MQISHIKNACIGLNKIDGYTVYGTTLQIRFKMAVNSLIRVNCSLARSTGHAYYFEESGSP